MAAPRNPFSGVLGGRPRLLEGGVGGRGGGRGRGFSRQRQLDLERAARQAEQNLLNQRAQEAARQLKLRGDRAAPIEQSRGFKGFSPDPRKVSGRVLKERTEPLRRQRAAVERAKVDDRFKEIMARPENKVMSDKIKALDTEQFDRIFDTSPDEIGNVSQRLLKERTQPLRAERAAKAKAARGAQVPGSKTFTPLRLDPDQVEQNVTKFARPVTARDVRRGGFQTVTRESAPAQELEARLAQVGVRERTVDLKLGEATGFQRTEFRFTQGTAERPGTLIGTVTEVPANNPAQKMTFVSLRTEGVPGAKGDPIVFLVPNRVSALGVIDQVREDFHGVPLPRLEIPSGPRGRVPRQVFPRPPIPFDRLERGVILDLAVGLRAFPSQAGSLASFVKNPSLRTARDLAGPLSETDSPIEMAGAVRGVVLENGDVILFPVDVFHETAMQSLGLDQRFLEPGGEAQPFKFILEMTRRKGFQPFFDNPIAARRLLRTNKNLRRLFRADELPAMLKGSKPSSPRPISPATTPREPIL